MRELVLDVYLFFAAHNLDAFWILGVPPSSHHMPELSNESARPELCDHVLCLFFLRKHTYFTAHFLSLSYFFFSFFLNFFFLTFSSFMKPMWLITPGAESWWLFYVNGGKPEILWERRVRCQCGRYLGYCWTNKHTNTSVLHTRWCQCPDILHNLTSACHMLAQGTDVRTTFHRIWTGMEPSGKPPGTSRYSELERWHP